jgi:MFS family permease
MGAAPGCGVRPDRAVGDGGRADTRRLFQIGLAGFTRLADVRCIGVGSDDRRRRVVQGVFGALLIPQGFSLLMRVFPREELGRVFGLFGPLMAVSSISDPVLAGFLLWAIPSAWTGGRYS